MTHALKILCMWWRCLKLYEVRNSWFSYCLLKCLGFFFPTSVTLESMCLRESIPDSLEFKVWHSTWILLVSYRNFSEATFHKMWHNYHNNFVIQTWMWKLSFLRTMKANISKFPLEAPYTRKWTHFTSYVWNE